MKSSLLPFFFWQNKNPEPRTEQGSGYLSFVTSIKQLDSGYICPSSAVERL
jgi:hypothetical protein